MKSQYSSMLLFVFPLVLKATTYVELEIQTCNDQIGANQGRVAEGYFRFHGTEGFTGWRKWDEVQTPGSQTQTSDVDVGTITDVVIGTPKNATYDWCIELVWINGEVLWNPQNATGGVYLGVNCQRTDGIRPCAGAHVWMVPNTRDLESQICRTHADCHNNQENGEGYCDIFGNCYAEEWCCHYRDSFDGTCPNQDSCDSNTFHCTSHADCGAWDQDQNRVESHFCTVYNYCEPVEWCCFYRNSINGPDSCPTECTPPEHHDVCREYSGARPCVPNFIFPYPLSQMECQDRCMQYEFCTGIQSHTHFGGWDECALILGDSCDLDEMRWFGGEYTVIARACFDPDLHDLVAENYTRHSGTNCISQSQSQWAFQEISQAITTCDFLPDCQAVVDKGCDASTFYLCMRQDEITTNSASCLYFKNALGRNPIISTQYDSQYDIRVHSCSNSPSDAVLELELIGHNGGLLLLPLRLDGNSGDGWTTGQFMGDIGPIDRMRLYPSTMEIFCIDSLMVNDQSWNSTFGTPQLWLSSDCSAYRMQPCSELQYLEALYTVYTCVTVRSYTVDDELVHEAVGNNGHIETFIVLSVSALNTHYYPVDTTRIRLLQDSMTVNDEFCWAGEITDLIFEVFTEVMQNNNLEDRLLATGTHRILRPLGEQEGVVHNHAVPVSSGHGSPGEIQIRYIYTRNPPDEARQSTVNQLHKAHCNGTEALQEFQCGKFTSEIDFNARACGMYRISPGAQCTLSKCVFEQYENRNIICTESGAWHLEFTPTMAPTDGKAYIKISDTQCEQVNVDTSCSDVSGLMDLGYVRGFCGWHLVCPDLARSVYVSSSCGSYSIINFPADCSQCHQGCIDSTYPVTMREESSSEDFAEEYPWVFPLVICTLVMCICFVFYMIWIQRQKKHAIRNLKTQEQIESFSKRQLSFVGDPVFYEDPVIAFPHLPANALAVNHYQVGDSVEVSVNSRWKKSTVIATEKMRVQCKIDDESNIHWMDVGSDKIREVPQQLSRPVVSTSALSANAGGFVSSSQSDEHIKLRQKLNWKDDLVIKIKFESILTAQGVRLQDQEFDAVFTFLSNSSGLLSWKTFTQFLFSKSGDPYNPEDHPKLLILRDQILYLLNSKSEIIDVSDNISQINTPILPSENNQPDTMILLNVNMIESNSTISVAARPNESVKTVIGRIRSMSAVPELNYSLSFQGSTLEPSAPLSFYDISSRNKLTARVQIQDEVSHAI